MEDANGMNILDQSVIKKGKLENGWKNYASAVFNYLIISYFSTITGFWGKSAYRRNHCSMDLGQKVISGEYTLAHLFTHALNHIWYLNDVTCLFS